MTLTMNTISHTTTREGDTREEAVAEEAEEEGEVEEEEAVAVVEAAVGEAADTLRTTICTSMMGLMILITSLVPSRLSSRSLLGSSHSVPPQRPIKTVSMMPTVSFARGGEMARCERQAEREEERTQSVQCP
jgi:hypothetical protein